MTTKTIPVTYIYIGKNQEEMYSLTDDFGGQVLLSKEQLTVIQEALEELDNS